MRRQPTRSTLFPYTTLFRSKMMSKHKNQDRIMTEKDSVMTEKTAVEQDSAESLEEYIVELLKAILTAGVVALFIKSFAFERSEEHTSELQSHSDLVCRLLLE